MTGLQFSLQMILAMAVAGAVSYSLLSTFAAFAFLRIPRPIPKAGEPISVLKPLAGVDDGLEQNLRSFFEQDYRDFELIFAVRHELDACVPLLERLQKEYASVPSRLLITGESPYPNAKVFSLSGMFEVARHDLLVMSDSDIRVDCQFLARSAGEFADGSVSLATCPYFAIAGASFWSRMEAQGMNTTFWQGALTARLLDGMKFAVGPTIVARKKAIEAIGGVESVKDFLADDFELGRLAAESGANVVLSRNVVEHRIGSETARQNFAHRIRWGRTSRRSRPFGYGGQIFTYPLPLALFLLVVKPGWWPLAASAIGIRFLAGEIVARWVLGGRMNWILAPLEDLIGFVFWIAGFFGNSVSWRGRTYQLDRQGRGVA